MKYIKFLDADDLIINKTTSTLMNFLEKEKNIVLAYGLQRKVKDITKENLMKNLIPIMSLF